MQKEMFIKLIHLSMYGHQNVLIATVVRGGIILAHM